MTELNFYALVEGKIPSPFDNDPAWPYGTLSLTVADVGTVRVPSGRLEVCDPFVELGVAEVVAIEPGEYPVMVTIADLSAEQNGSHLREAYMSLILADGEAASVEQARNIDGDDCFVGADSGSVAFVDRAAATRVPKDLQDQEWFFDRTDPKCWFNFIESPEHHRVGLANIALASATDGENIVLSGAGWGDGCYPVMITRDSEGKPLGLHIDLGVVTR